MKSQALIGLLLAFLIAGCGSSDPGPSEITFGEVWQARLPDILAVASESQRLALSDGVIDASEYEAAFLSYRSCIEAGGAVILTLERDEKGVIKLMAVADGSSSGAQALVAGCDEKHFRYVAEGWRIALDPDDSEVRQLARVAQCLKEQGYEVPEQPADNAALLSALSAAGKAAHDAYLDCVDTVQ